MRWSLLPLLAILTACAGTPSTPARDANRDVGAIDFPTSTRSAEAQAHFLRGATILHSFGFKQARAEFQAAQKLDPDFALAYWGESLCYNHPFLPEWDRETPQAILARLGATPEERLAKAPTDRENGFVRAVEALFYGEGDLHARRTAHMEAMRDLFAAHPGDDEVRAHYALSLISAGGAAGEAGERKRVLSGSIALDLFHRDPDHPGAAHYTIHAFDDPIHAILALPAARKFASIAPAVSHARHMPSHIFIQLGMWDEVSTGNQSAYQAAVDLFEPGDSAGDMTHAIDWGQYGDLQRGDYARSQAWIDILDGLLTRDEHEGRVATSHPLMRARHVIETRQWATTAIGEDSPAPELYATGLSAVKLGDLDLAERAAAGLARHAAKAAEGESFYRRTAKPLAIMAKQVSGTLAIARGDEDGGLALLAESVAIAEAMPLPRGPARPNKPAHELYGEALLEAGRPDEAIAAFSESLLRMPRRALSVLGVARAHAAAGDPAAARERYAQLAEIWQGRDFPELREAEKLVARRDGD